MEKIAAVENHQSIPVVIWWKDHQLKVHLDDRITLNDVECTDEEVAAALRAMAAQVMKEKREAEGNVWAKSSSVPEPMPNTEKP
jgi:hypothetical protein